MQLLKQIAGDEVWEIWRQVEGHSSLLFRTDIRDCLPNNLIWHLCEVQEEDIDRFYIISSDDWADISEGSFLVANVTRRIDLPSSNQDTQRIAQDIARKIAYMRSGGQLDTRLIVITDSTSLYGPFTLIEGNKRAVAFTRMNVFVGSSVFVGYSPCVVDCIWARHTYRQFLASRQSLQ